MGPSLPSGGPGGQVFAGTLRILGGVAVLRRPGLPDALLVDQNGAPALGIGVDGSGIAILGQEVPGSQPPEIVVLQVLP
jgi:hypothetical protein